MPKTLQLLIAIAICAGAGGIGVLTTSEVSEFYTGLDKPDLAPPPEIFAPVWTVLYVMLGIVLYRIWQHSFRSSATRIALGLFIFQLVLNALWTPIFFNTQDAGLALLDIALMDLAVLGLILLLWSKDKVSVVLLLPYLIWIGYATWLTYKLLVLNAASSVPLAV